MEFVIVVNIGSCFVGLNFVLDGITEAQRIGQRNDNVGEHSEDHIHQQVGEDETNNTGVSSSFGVAISSSVRSPDKGDSSEEEGDDIGGDEDEPRSESVNSIGRQLGSRHDTIRFLGRFAETFGTSGDVVDGEIVDVSKTSVQNINNNIEDTSQQGFEALSKSSFSFLLSDGFLHAREILGDHDENVRDQSADGQRAQLVFNAMLEGSCSSVFLDGISLNLAGEIVLSGRSCDGTVANGQNEGQSPQADGDHEGQVLREHRRTHPSAGTSECVSIHGNDNELTIAQTETKEGNEQSSNNELNCDTSKAGNIEEWSIV
mmetsp:Transcript_3913/g.4298  ORF Transcript_3913/g.4298 Transcript_3913/m.4298 type:complete len:317 (-) Transcript_3913:535-1485(-)